MNDQEMPTADGQMASNTSEEVVPPRADRDASPGDASHDDGESHDDAKDGDDPVTLDALP